MYILTGASGNDPKNDFELFLQNYAWVLCVGVVVIIALTILIIFVIKNRNKSKTKKKEISQASGDDWIIALGDKDNIGEILVAGSRLSISLKDTSKIDRNKLLELGIKNVVVMSNKVTLVSDLDNQKILENIQKSLQN